MKPSVLLYDTLDDRREVVTLLLRGLPPAAILDFLDWAIQFARGTCDQPMLLQNASADRQKMAERLRLAERGIDHARFSLAYEVYTDLGSLAHHFGMNWLAVIEELEQWAGGRRTPVIEAVRQWRRRFEPAAVSTRSPDSSGSVRPSLVYPS